MNSVDSTLRAVAAEGHEARGRAAIEARDGRAPVFAADRAGADALGQEAQAAFLAELLLHRQAETPFVVGLLGPAGTGKSTFLIQVVAAAGRLAAAAGAAGPASPFHADVVTVRVPGAAVGEEALAEVVLGRLGQTHPALAAELRHAGADPAEEARRTEAALDEARRRLGAERQALDELTGREARLVDALVEAPGSLLDTEARARRSRNERILRRFGYGGGDTVATYKALVREAAEAKGGLSRAGLIGRALWSYKGQARLLVTAAVLFALAWGVGVLRADAGGWAASVGEVGGERAAPLAGWLGAHAGWLGPIENGLILLGAVLVLLNVVRAARFVLPLARGVDLLQQEADSRRRDLGGQLAHQTRRVDALAAEVEAAARAAREAERRAEAAADAPEPGQGEGRASALFGALGRAMGEDAPGHAAPSRLVLAVDGLQADPGEAARSVEALGRLLGPGCVAVVAADPLSLLTGFSETDPARAQAEFARLVQLPYDVTAGEAVEAARKAYAAALIGLPAGGAQPAAAAAGPVEATRSALDAPWRPREAETLAALAPFAGDTPRALKRFVNLYRVARADPRLAGAPGPVFTALALALAVDGHGLPEELDALARASHGEAAGGSPQLRRALAVAREVSGEPVEVALARRALDVAASYSGQARVSL